MRKLALTVIIIESIALVMLSIFAKVQSSKANVHEMAAYKQQQLLIMEKEINEQLTEELLQCREVAKDSAATVTP